MNERFRAEVLGAWQSRVGASGINSLPASEPKLKAFEAEFGPIPDEFRWFLASCGGGPIGSVWVDSINELPATHKKFRAEFGPPRGWTMSDVFVIGWDGGGNPFGIQVPTGRVLVEDHDFGGIHEMASSFAAFLAKGLS
ncbi:MAG: SMI1/KNR4 family protein [Gemmatales bacterium]